MTGSRLVALAISVLMLGTNAFGDDSSPGEILKKVEATYKAMKTYKAEGTITSDIDTGGMKMKAETSSRAKTFSISAMLPRIGTSIVSPAISRVTTASVLRKDTIGEILLVGGSGPGAPRYYRCFAFYFCFCFFPVPSSSFVLILV